jgi:hypothetical protein
MVTFAGRAVGSRFLEIKFLTAEFGLTKEL